VIGHIFGGGQTSVSFGHTRTGGGHVLPSGSQTVISSQDPNSEESQSSGLFVTHLFGRYVQGCGSS